LSSLYLHIPFCRSKCPYCDFYSQPGSAVQLVEYVDLLCAEIEILAQQHPLPDALQTIFFGGGTPSLLTVRQVERVLGEIGRWFGISDLCEITLEANPGTLDENRLLGFRQAGVNRLSLGVQSLCDQQLKLLGRGHTAAEACGSVERARKAGFENLNLDLMFGRPWQGSIRLAEELEGLLTLQPQHISLYGLSYETGTDFSARLQRGELTEIDEDEYAEQYSLLQQRLKTAGFEQYEISNFCLPGFRCRHNQVYWQRKNCLAAGCGAHSFYAAGWGERRVVPPDLEKYRDYLSRRQDPSEQLETFDRDGAMAETVYLALRTSDGIDRKQFYATFGLQPEEAYPKAFSQLFDRLQQSDDRWIFKPDSWLVYDHLISHFL